MAAKWNSSGYPVPVPPNSFPDQLTKLKLGVDTAVTEDAGTSDPSTGAPTPWGAAEVGRRWYDRTNEAGAGGDDLGGETKRWERTAPSTYSMRDTGVRGYFASEPNTVVLTVTASSVTAWTDLDVGGATTSDRALAVKLQVEVVESNPGAGVSFGLRKKGVTTDGLVRRVYPQVSGISVGAEVTVELDTSQTLQYQLAASGNTSASLSVAVLGYWERG